MRTLHEGLDAEQQKAAEAGDDAGIERAERDRAALDQAFSRLIPLAALVAALVVAGIVALVVLTGPHGANR